MKHEKFLRGAAVMTGGLLIAKVIGACYRIPLTGLLGGYGVGLYQMAYPLFLLFLTFSSAGIPSALSRAVARETALGRETTSLMKTALSLFAAVGLAGSFLMCLVAVLMSGLQGEGNLVYCYYALAPSVFFVSLISVFRGYFQGKNNMVPTAVSEVCEQAVKAGIGFLAAFAANDAVRGAVYALVAVTVSELVTLLLLIRRYAGERKVPSLRKVSKYRLFGSVFPVMVSAALLPLSRTLDSVVIVRLMSAYTDRAVTLYGLFTGGAMTLVDLPAQLAGGFVAVAVPAISYSFSRGKTEEGRKKTTLALLFTFLVAVPAAILLFSLAPHIVRFLYAKLAEEDKNTVVTLIRLSAVSAVTLAGTNTLSACLTGMGRAKQAAVSMLTAVAVKFALQFLLVSSPAFSIGGAAVAANVCYLVAFFMNLYYTYRKNPRVFSFRAPQKRRGKNPA